MDFSFLVSGILSITWQQAVMYVVGAVLIYLAIEKGFEPSLLMPMGFGAILVNLPLSGVIDQVSAGVGETHGIIDWLFDVGIEASEAMPILLFIGIVDLPDAIGVVAGYGFGVGGSNVFAAAAQIVGGGGALAAGLLLRRGLRLERQLDKVVGDRDNIPLDELFAAAGLTYKEGRKVLESAIDHGYFGADAYIDNRTDFLVVRGDAPIPAPPASDPAPDPAPDGETQYQRLLRQLHEAGAALADAQLREKAARLEAVSARIFALAEADPEKEEQLRKFTGYYLPTALKLLHTYAQLDGQGVDGENITKTKQSIERSLDLLITAFENQLDKLFQSDALDVSADIAALEGMLNLDGLSGESDFNLQ